MFAQVLKMSTQQVKLEIIIKGNNYQERYPIAKILKSSNTLINQTDVSLKLGRGH